MTKYWLILAIAAATACSSSDSGDDDGLPSADAAPVGDGLATISGTIGRSVEPMAGGVGPVYIALFTEDPVTSMVDPPTPVQTVVIDDADLSAADAAIPYALDDVPVSEEPYYVSAFLDDNRNATADAAGPDMGDLVSLDGFASPEVIVDSDGTIPFDIDLNLAMPF